MKFFLKKNCLILISIIIFSINSDAYSKSKYIKYSKEDISNYFIGIVSANQNLTNSAFNHLNKVQNLKNNHSNFEIEFIRTLVLLEKFDTAFEFSKKAETQNKLSFESNLLLGIDSFIDKDYPNAEKYFKKLSSKSRYDLIFDDQFLGNILLSWLEASKGSKENAFIYFDKIPNRYYNLKKIQNSFLHCYFNTSETLNAFEKLIGEGEDTFLRYNFFLANYLLSKNKKIDAKTIIFGSEKKYNSNLLLKESKYFVEAKKIKKINNFFNCNNPKHNLAEIFYVMANLYSTEKDYQLSNFYLNISLFLNEKFTPNKALLAENLFFQKKYKLSKKIYKSLKSIGPVYSWHASTNIARIQSFLKDKKKSVLNLKKQFDSISNPKFEHYYDLANFYKDNEYYKESIKYYSLAMENIPEAHSLVPKILDRRGTSYERIGKWEEAEKDLRESLSILPDQPYVLNYLAYSWVEKKVNLDEALRLLKKANELKKNDGYIIDSLGWAYFANKNYIDAEKFLQRAVELMPLEAVINDHYADALWMLNKNIQSRYFWKHALSLDTAEEKLKEKISNKLIFGISENL